VMRVPHAPGDANALRSLRGPSMRHPGRDTAGMRFSTPRRPIRRIRAPGNRPDPYWMAAQPKPFIRTRRCGDAVRHAPAEANPSLEDGTRDSGTLA
jgi:hypothetical protein